MQCGVYNGREYEIGRPQQPPQSGRPSRGEEKAIRCLIFVAPVETGNLSFA